MRRACRRSRPSWLCAQTCIFDVLYAYLSTANYDFSCAPHAPPWRLHARSHARRALCCADDRAKNLRPKRNIKTAMNNEIMLYGIAQKEQLGFDKAVEECSAHAPPEPHTHSRTLTCCSFARAQSTA